MRTIRHRHLAASALLLTAATANFFAQAPIQSSSPTFDVVSIKRNTSNALGSNGSSERPDGGFTLINIPIGTLISRPAGLPSVTTAVQEQLGMRLESGRAARETLVIDRLERPTEN
jgi:hypothetical protein